MNYKQLFNYALKTGAIMLENGAETYRVEDTIERILKTSNFEVIESFVTPTGIFVSFDDPSIQIISRIKRVRNRTLHLHKISEANSISRKYCNGKITLDEAWEQINKVEEMVLYRPLLIIASIGLAAGFYTLTQGATLIDFIIAFIIGILLGLILHYLNQGMVSSYFKSLIGGLFISLIAKFIVNVLGFGSNLDLIIIGSLMPLVPGVAITNGIMDTIRGDLVSGISRSVDAFVTASFIAIGVGIGLKLFMF